MKRNIYHPAIGCSCGLHTWPTLLQSVCNVQYYTPNGYIVPMEFRVHFFPRISAFSRRTQMHLNGMLLIGIEFFKIIVPLYQPPISW